MKFPHEIVVEEGALSKISGTIKGTGLVVTSPTVGEVAGKKVAEFLNSDIVIIEKAGFDAVEKAEDKAKASNVDFLIGVGGGVPIDTAKVAADRLDISFISVPTAASHDGIVSSRASIPDKGTRHSFEVDPPLSVISDTSIISKAPFKLTASGFADIIANYSAVKDWKLADGIGKDKYNKYAGSLSQASATTLTENSDLIKPESEKGTALVIQALVCSGIAMSLEGSSRPASGSEHAFSHALDSIDSQRALHGEQCGVGSIISMYLHRDNWKKIRDTLDSVGAPINSEQLGFSSEEIKKALIMAKEIRPERYTILNQKDEDKLEKAAKETRVI